MTDIAAIAKGLTKALLIAPFFVVGWIFNSVGDFLMALGGRK